MTMEDFFQFGFEFHKLPETTLKRASIEIDRQIDITFLSEPTG